MKALRFRLTTALALSCAFALVALPAEAKKKKPAAPSDSADPKADVAPAGSSHGPDAVPLEEGMYGPELPSATPEPVLAKEKPFQMTRGRILIGARAGALMPEPFSALGPSFFVGIELGWALPKLPGIGRGLAVTIDLAYTQPTASGMGTDPRIAVNGGAYRWDLTQRQLQVGLNVLYRFNGIGSGKFVPYLGIGPRLFFLQSNTGGEAGAGNAIASYNEQSAHIGMGLPIGADYLVGPGRIFLEAMLLYAPFNHNATGPSSAGAITVDAGYRFLL